MGPLFPNNLISGEWNLLIALFIGMAFGFLLEASGFSSARNIAGAFYGYNFVVVRVFFTAVIVSMVGLLYLGYFGWLNLSQIFILPTYLPSMITGAVIMGVGMIIGGFCPGTSLTAVVIGKIDALFFAIGLYLGILLFAEGYPFLEKFYHAGYLGHITLTELTGIKAGWWAFGFTVIALAAFWVTAIIEKKVRKRIKEYKF